MIKNFGPITNCISRINNRQVYDTHDIDVVMPLYNLLEYSHNYAKTPGILWQYCRDERTFNGYGAIDDFTTANAITD